MWLYNIIVLLYSLMVRIASMWMPKAKLWSEGRKNIFERMAQAISPDDRIVWIHVASLGEFEQGRPLLERIREEHPEYKILLTFFSPSGYEVQKNYAGADYIFYLPIDTPRNARRFLDVAHPEIVIFVKYEFWLNMLYELHRRNIKSYIVSAIFRPGSIFFRNYGQMWRRALKSFEVLFIQNQESKELLHTLGFDNVVIAGDTRFDRVAQIAQGVKENPIIARFKGESQLFIAGSTWPADELLLGELVKANEDLKFVIAPHEIGSERVEALQSQFGGAIRYTQIDEGVDLSKAKILILDTMGQLSRIYRYASWAYIGGGFGVGIHNTLEAATFGLPMSFGPNYQKFNEAKELVRLGGSSSVNNSEELVEWLGYLRTNEELYKKRSLITKQYTQSQQGAAKIITKEIFS
ncbi:MAG: glycosyltransferase N-terminal domain-containing protein [Rikenellaceae bacterium]